MKNVFTKSIVGGAVLIACGLAQSATVSRTVSYSSTERNAIDAAANGAASVRMPTFTINLSGTGYVDGDKVTLSFSAGALRLSSLGTVDTETVTCVGELVAGTDVTALKLKLNSVDSRTATYTVTSRDPAVKVNPTTTLKGIRCPFPNVDMLASSLTSTTVISLNWNATTATGTVHDQLTDVVGNPAVARSLHIADTQFAAGAAGDYVTGGAARSRTIKTSSTAITSSIIAPAGFVFADTTPTSTVTSASVPRSSTGWAGTTQVVHGVYRTADYYSIGTSNAAPAANAAAVDNVVVSLAGNFSFLDNDNNGCSVDDLSSGSARLTLGAGTTVTAVASNCSEIQYTSATVTGTDSLTVSLYNGLINNGNKALPVGSITATVTFRNGSTVVGTAAGAVATWTNDAQSAIVNYMPYGPGISRIVYVTNNSTTSAVTISAVNEAGTACASTSFPSVTATTNRPISLSSAMDAGVESCYGTGYNGKVRFTISLNVPSVDAFGITLGEQTLTPRQAAPAGSSARAAATSIGDALATGATTGQVSGRITRNNDPFEIYSAYNVNGNRVQVINSTNGR